MDVDTEDIRAFLRRNHAGMYCPLPERQEDHEAFVYNAIAWMAINETNLAFHTVAGILQELIENSEANGTRQPFMLSRNANATRDSEHDTEDDSSSSSNEVDEPSGLNTNKQASKRKHKSSDVSDESQSSKRSRVSIYLFLLLVLTF